MKHCRLLGAALAAVGLALAGCGKNNASPATPPAEAASGWWRAVASGDGRTAAGFVAGDRAAQSCDRSVAEYARVRKAAAEGDVAAVRMLGILQDITVGKVDAGPEMALVKLVTKDGRTFMTLRMENRNGRWVIVELI